MNRLTLTLHNTICAPLDASSMSPASFQGQSLKQICATPIRIGTTPAVLADAFDVAGQTGEEILIRCGTSGRCLTDVGAQLSAGRVIVEGNVGARAGRAMTGGELEIRGDAGDYLGAGMTYGNIRVTGNAGNFTAAALPGYRYGLAGGQIKINGNVGHRLADRMRRGVVSVDGNTGDWPVARLIAGTVDIKGSCGTGFAIGMRRGTVVVTGVPDSLAQAGETGSFVDGGPLSPVFSQLLGEVLNRLDQENASPNSGKPGDATGLAHAKRYLGDRLVDGQGEILVWPSR